MTDMSARPLYQELRVALRDLNPLGLEEPGDSYDSAAANAARVLLDGGDDAGAADMVVETLRVEHGILLQGVIRRRMVSRIRAADPRLAEVRSGGLLRWVGSWQVDVLLLILVVSLAWSAFSAGRPWVLLAFPGLMGFVPAWALALRLPGAPKGQWVYGALPPLLFAVVSSAVLLLVASPDESYFRSAYASLLWVALAGLGARLRGRTEPRRPPSGPSPGG